MSLKKASFISEKLRYLDQIHCQVKAATLLMKLNVQWRMNHKKIGTASIPTSFALMLKATLT